MVEISDISDRESLIAWLSTPPFDGHTYQHVAVAIAHRSAMRVLPEIWLSEDREPNATANAVLRFGVLRANLISGVASTRPSAPIRKAAYTAYSTTANASDSVTSGSIPSDAAYALNLANSLTAWPMDIACVSASASAYSAAVANSFAGRPIDAAGAAGAAAQAAAMAAMRGAAVSSDAFWQEIQSDCRAFTRPGALLDETPLWSGPNPFEKDWQDIRAALPPDWAFWRDWYQDALDGKKPNWDMLEEIALTDPEDWDKGADHMNGLIARIVEKSRDGGNASATETETKLPPLSTQAQRAIAERVRLNRDNLALSIAGVLHQIEEFREAVRGRNDLDPQYRDDLLAFLGELGSKLTELLHSLPGENELITDQKASALVRWLQEFRPLITTKSKAYVSPKNIAESIVPTGIILMSGGIGALVGGPAGFMPGAVVGGLITGQVKPGKALEEMFGQESDPTDDPG